MSACGGSAFSGKNKGSAKIGLIIGLIVVAVVIVLIILLAVGIIVYTKSGKKAVETVKEIAEEEILPLEAEASQFAAYKEVEVNIDPNVPKYEVEADLSNAVNKERFTLSPLAEEMLAENNFVVVPGYRAEFFPLYEENRYDKIPNFVTTDSIVHNYHLMFDDLLKKLEEEKLIPELKNLNALMMAESESQYEELKGTEWENAAKRNVGFFSVGSQLLDNSAETPTYVSSVVDEELNLIEAKAGITASPLWKEAGGSELLEDYSQYIPRGHYDKSEQLKAYFKTMMWYGRLTFRLKEEEETKSAVLVTMALDKANNQESWDKIYEPTNFFVGKSDDITYYQTEEILKKVYGGTPDLSTVISDTEKMDQVVTQMRALEPPQINSMPIYNADIQPDREKEIKGFRFMGQRFTIDASVFQRLIYREVGDKESTCEEGVDNWDAQGARYLPKALDVTAAMGSSEALDILNGQGETEYACYTENMTKMSDYINELDTDTWTQNLYWGWLYSLKPLTEEKGEGYPQFMQNQAWTRKDLNSYLGSYTELKHDTILYAKQVYAELGGGPEPTYTDDDRGYVEPNVYVYSRLAGLLAMTKEGLEARNLLSADYQENLTKMEELVLQLKTISEKELNNETLTDDEYELIRSYGGQIEHFWLDINEEDMKKKGLAEDSYLSQNPAALVSDVATDPNGAVLEEATGYISDIYVVMPVDGVMKILKGGVYSYYEFSWPMDDRLTDSKWWDLLDSAESPPNLPEWTQIFTTY